VSTTVARTLRLVADGGFHGRSVEELSGRLGISARHLHRLFTRHLGASPKAVARTQRLHFAKKLLDETELAVAEIALASGFGSVRSFNEAFRKTYDRTPREVRQLARDGCGGSSSDGWSLKLAYRPPFDHDALIGFLGPRATPGVEQVDGTVYRRSLEIDGSVGALEVRPAPGRDALVLTVHHPDPRALFPIATRTRRLFDLDADPVEVSERLWRDGRLARLARRRPGLRVAGAWDGFELAVRAILGQQVSVKAATTLAGRVAERYGREVRKPVVEGLDRLFPRPAELCSIEPAKVGLTAARARAVEHLARAVRDGKLDLSETACPDEARRALAALPGLGTWTVEYVAMRGLRDPDAFPASDLGLRTAWSTGGRRITAAQLRARAEAWRPWRAYAAMHLWCGSVR
jgi:AraC family transcriptional regulator of adaptative response / DNA-3-methyladenine glycosylase II